MVVLDRLCRSEQGKYAILYLFGGEGFENISLCPCGDGIAYMILAALGGDHNDWNAGGQVLLSQFAQEFESIHVRHIDIGENQVHALATEHVERLDSVGRFKDLNERQAGLAQ